MRYQEITGIDTCLGIGEYGSQIDESAAGALLDRFVALGGNFINTAHIYGAWD